MRKFTISDREFVGSHRDWWVRNAESDLEQAPAAIGQGESCAEMEAPEVNT